ARIPWMATAEPTQAQPATSQQAMRLDGFLRVTGTAGIETTVARHHRTDGVPVDPDRYDGQFTHGMLWPDPLRLAAVKACETSDAIALRIAGRVRGCPDRLGPCER